MILSSNEKVFSLLKDYEGDLSLEEKVALIHAFNRNGLDGV